MRLLLTTFLYLFGFFFFLDHTLALTDYQIREICRKERRKFTCIKILQKKKYNLLEGNRIEIPVIPFKGNNNF